MFFIEDCFFTGLKIGFRDGVIGLHFPQFDQFSFKIFLKRDVFIVDVLGFEVSQFKG